MVNRAKAGGSLGCRLLLEFFKMESQYLKKFVSNQYGVVIDSQHELENEYNKAKEEGSFDLEELDIRYEDEVHERYNVFPLYINNYAYVACYSYFENFLPKLCKRMEFDQGYGMKLNDLKGTDLDKCWAYLTKVVSLKLDGLNQDWVKIKEYKNIRNQIVHHNSYYHKDSMNDQRLNKIIERFALVGDITIVPHRKRFAITKAQLTIDFLGLGELFIERIINQYENQYA